MQPLEFKQAGRQCAGVSQSGRQASGERRRQVAAVETSPGRPWCLLQARPPSARALVTLPGSGLRRREQGGADWLCNKRVWSVLCCQPTPAVMHRMWDARSVGANEGLSCTRGRAGDSEQHFPAGRINSAPVDRHRLVSAVCLTGRAGQASIPRFTAPPCKGQSPTPSPPSVLACTALVVSRGSPPSASAGAAGRLQLPIGARRVPKRPPPHVTSHRRRWAACRMRRRRARGACCPCSCAWCSPSC